MLIKSQCHSLYPVYCMNPVTSPEYGRWRRQENKKSKINTPMWLRALKNNGPTLLNRPWDASLAHKTASIKSLLSLCQSLCIKSLPTAKVIEARIAKIQKLLTTADSTFYHERSNMCQIETQNEHVLYSTSAVSIYNDILNLYTPSFTYPTYILLVDKFQKLLQV